MEGVTFVIQQHRRSEFQWATLYDTERRPILPTVKAVQLDRECALWKSDGDSNDMFQSDHGR
jgi:hypothetical protein